MTATRAHPRTRLATALCLALAAGCNRGEPRAPATDTPAQSSPGVNRDAAVPADRVAARRVSTLYHWLRTEPGDESTHGESIEHGTPKLHLVFEMHRAPDDRGWLTVSALAGSVGIPESVRMRAEPAPASQWHVPRGGYNEVTLEQFGGELRGDEPVRVFLARAPDSRLELPAGATPQPVRLPAAGFLPASSQAEIGRYDAIAVVVVPMVARRGGRYLVYAVDFLPQAGGFPVNGVMTHAPTAGEIERYVAWIRDASRIGHTNPPIPMQPIDR